MLFADDIMLVNESRDGLNVTLERWQKTLESKGFKISQQRQSIQIVASVGRGEVQRAETSIKIEAQLPNGYHKEILSDT